MNPLSTIKGTLVSGLLIVTGGLVFASAWYRRRLARYSGDSLIELIIRTSETKSERLLYLSSEFISRDLDVYLIVLKVPSA